MDEVGGRREEDEEDKEEQDDDEGDSVMAARRTGVPWTRWESKKSAEPGSSGTTVQLGAPEWERVSSMSVTVLRSVDAEQSLRRFCTAAD